MCKSYENRFKKTLKLKSWYFACRQLEPISIDLLLLIHLPLKKEHRASMGVFPISQAEKNEKIFSQT